MDTTIPVADPRPNNADAAAFGPCAVPAHFFRAGFDAVRQFRSTDQARPIIAAILLEHREDGLGLVATNSYTLASITVPWLSEPPEAFEPVMLAGESVAAVWAAVKDVRGHGIGTNGRPSSVTLTAASDKFGDTVTVDIRKEGFIVAKVIGAVQDGDYVNYQALFPAPATAFEGWRNGDGPEFVALNPTYMARICKAGLTIAKADGRNGSGVPLRWTFTNGLKPAVATIRVLDSVRGDFLLMPVKV